MSVTENALFSSSGVTLEASYNSCLSMPSDEFSMDRMNKRDSDGFSLRRLGVGLAIYYSSYNSTGSLVIIEPSTFLVFS